jgi:multiple sugar transport system ATP-binding protein
VKPAEGAAVVYGIRPEHLELSPNGLPARISVVEPTGSETMVFLRFGEHDLVALFRERHDFKPGDTLTLKPRAEQIHLFDAGSGTRL